MTGIAYICSAPLESNPRASKEIVALTEAGHKVVLIVWARNQASKVICKQIVTFGVSIDCYSIGVSARIGGGLSNGPAFLRFQWTAFRLLHKLSRTYDVIHACDLDTGLLALVAARFLKKKLVYDIYDYYSESRRHARRISGIVSRIENAVISRADLTIVCTEERIQQIAGSHPRHLIVVHNSPPTLPPPPATVHEAQRDKIKVCYVGSLSDTRYVVEVADVVASLDLAEFHVAGSGNADVENRIRHFATRSPNVVFHDTMPYEQALELEESCDVMVALYDPEIPNHRYAAPNKFYEALMLRKLLVVVQGTSIDEAVSRYDLGEVITGRRTTFHTEFAEALRRIAIRIKNPNHPWEKTMDDLYSQQYSWETMAQRLQSAYAEYIS